VSEEEYIGIVGEIFDGCTEISYQGKSVYLKHFSIRDQRYIHKFYNKYKKIAESRGIPSEAEMLESLRVDGIWTDEDDSTILNLEQEIEGLKGSQRVALLPSQKQSLQKTIDEKRQQLLFVQTKKINLLGKTSESYGSVRANEEFIRYLLYSDPECSNHLFSEQEFAELSEESVEYFVSMHEEIAKRLSERNIQKSVLRDFFNMYLSQTESVSEFYGKSIIMLSAYQLKLAIYAKIFFNIFQYNDDMPEYIKKDPDAIFSFSESKRNSSKGGSGRGDSDSGASAIFNATKEDLDFVDPNARKISLADEIEKKGGKMNMDDLINLMG
jgi:hypothetical protein